jgi:hypothetical protein
MATAAAPETPPPAPRRLSEELELILREFDVEEVTLREVMTVLHGRGFILLMLLLSLPFCTPIPLPGLSTPLGCIILLIAIRLALGQKPWLPARFLDLRLPPATFRRVFAFTRRLVLGFERLLRPRLPWVTASPGRQQLHALPIMVCAIFLLLPLPVPFSNVIPAWAIILMAAGLLERDGAFILAGYGCAALATAFFTAIGFLGVGAVDLIWQWVSQVPA